MSLHEIQEIREGVDHADFAANPKFCEGTESLAFSILYGKDFRLKVGCCVPMAEEIALGESGARLFLVWLRGRFSRELHQCVLVTNKVALGEAWTALF